ncbi:acid sphingomyelinase [Gloeopeniophorella convolvens]|nr:acid sphingomyelinase [Gloeopeniophorella convolvens]
MLYRRRGLGISLLTLLSRVNADVTADMLKALSTSKDCDACHNSLIPAFQEAAGTDETFVGNITAVCIAAKARIRYSTLTPTDSWAFRQLADTDVCEGEFALSGPILAHDLRALDANSITATKFCSALFGLCQPPPVTPFAVPLSPPSKNPKPRAASRGRTPFQVVHISDVHIDRNYTVGSDASCTKPICCRNFADEKSPVLAQSMLGAISQLAGHARFAVLTGDVVAHDTWLTDRPEVTTDLTSWNHDMLAGLPFPVYPTLGNHDSSPVNSFPRNGTNTNITSQWVFDLEAEGWQPWIGSAAARQEDHNSGSYALVVPGTKLRIIALNTMFWYIQNFWLYDSNTLIPDPNGVLAFLAAQLQAAENAGERAWITGHVPPGSSDFDHDPSNYYNQIIQRYKNTISSQFFGHTHDDQFQIAYSDFSNQTAETADSIVWIAPSLTPTNGNPAFRVYDVDPDTYEIMDSKTYIANMSDPSFQTNPKWSLLYSARQSYGPLVSGLKTTDSLDGPFWHRVTEGFVANDSAFQLYNARKSRHNIGDVTTCTGDCKNQTICDLRAARSENNCDVAAAADGQIGRRNLHEFVPVIREPACEVSVGHYLRAYISRQRGSGL